MNKLNGMNKLKDYFDTWLDGKPVRGVSVSLEDIRILQNAYDAIRANKTFYFLSANAKKVLDKCKIATVEDGIGWRIEADMYNVSKGVKNDSSRKS